MSANPFEVLRLDPTAGDAEVVRQAGRLRQRATDEAARNRIRQSVQALIGRPDERLLHVLLTHPAPSYQSSVLDRFTAVFRRPPATAAPASCPPLDLGEFRDLLREMAAGELELTPLCFELVAGGEEADEVRRQTAEVLWQSLLLDTRA